MVGSSGRGGVVVSEVQEPQAPRPLPDLPVDATLIVGGRLQEFAPEWE